VLSGYAGFNYNFGFDGSTTGDANVGGDRGFISPINFGNWTNLGSPITTGSNDQFSAFLQQTNNGDNGVVDTSFSFASFNYGGRFLISLLFKIKFLLLSSILDLGGSEISTDGGFGSFFFGNGGSPINNEQTQNEKSN